MSHPVLQYLKRRINDNMSYITTTIMYNDRKGRIAFKALIDSFFEANPDVTKFSTICDESNNPPDVVDSNAIVIHVAFSDSKDPNGPLMTHKVVVAYKGATFESLLESN